MPGEGQEDVKPVRPPDGHEDVPPPRPPFIFMAYAVGTASIFYIINVLCQWYQQLIG